MFFFWYMTRSGIAESCGSFSFLRKLHTVFHGRYTSLHSHQPVYQSSFFPTALPVCVTSVLFGGSHSDSVRWCLIVVLVCISLMISNMEHIFRCLLAFACSLRESVYSAQLIIKLDFFLYWVMWTVYVCWMLTSLISHIIYQYFLPFSRLSFSFTDGFLCWAKAFKSDWVPLVYFCFYFLCFRR